jgi:hypothetical protein
VKETLPRENLATLCELQAWLCRRVRQGYLAPKQTEANVRWRVALSWAIETLEHLIDQAEGRAAARRGA